MRQTCRAPASLEKKNTRRQRLFLRPRGCNKSLARVKDMALDVAEKPERLRRQPMTAARPAMQRVKNLHRLRTAAEFDPQAGGFCFADAASDSTVKTVEKILAPAGQVDEVAMKAQRWGSADPALAGASTFEVFPMPLAAQIHRRAIECRHSQQEWPRALDKSP